MRLRSFHGGSLSEAMRQVREAMGEDAIIVSTRDEEGGGVRVTAAHDDEPALAPPPATATLAPAAASSQLDDLADLLYAHGVHAALAEKILATALHYGHHDAALALAAAFDAHLKFAGQVQPIPPKPLVLVGPPGVGKTINCAKIATALRLQNLPVCVMTTDIVRAGGIDQLAAFTKLLKVRLLEIEDPQALRDTAREHQHQPVVIDTAGRNPFAASDLKELKQMLAQLNADTMLVLPVSFESVEGAEVAAIFRELGASRLLFSRSDAARRLGSMVNIAYGAGLPLAGHSHSASVTDPIESLNPVLLAKLFLATPPLAAFSPVSKTKAAS